MSDIEWTDETWNPVVGCSIVSPGCTNCYAMRQARRLAANPKTPHYASTVKTVNGKPVWTGKIGIAPDDVWTRPLRWRRPRMIFVNSMGDLFHESISDEVIDRAFAIMALTPQHIYQVLTKRADRMRAYFASEPEDRWNAQAGTLMHWDDMPEREVGPLPNVWLGVSAERQEEADARIPDLLGTPAAVRFVSAEPLLGEIDFCNLHSADPLIEIDALNGRCGVLRPHLHDSARLDWIIVGGESGPGARPMHPDWARRIRDDCAAAGVPFFFKQWGAWLPGTFGPAPELRWQGDGPIHDCNEFPADWDNERVWDDGMSYFDEGEQTFFYRAGKRRAGRLLDGRTHNDMPTPTPAPQARRSEANRPKAAPPRGAPERSEE